MGNTFREDLFRLEVDTGSGGYGVTDTLSELMEDVEYEYGDEIKAEKVHCLPTINQTIVASCQ